MRYGSFCGRIGLCHRSTVAGDRHGNWSTKAPRCSSHGGVARGIETMRITDIKATTVTVPLEAPLRHAAGCHWGRFVRTIVEVETDEGIVGLGEMGGGGESAEAVFRAMKSYLVGHDPTRLEEMRFKIANPTAL